MDNPTQGADTVIIHDPPPKLPPPDPTKTYEWSHKKQEWVECETITIGTPIE